MKKYIKGTYRKSIYNSANYYIGLFKVRETNDELLEDYVNKTITFTGYFLDLSEDDNYYFYGELVNHPKYGIQYQVTEYERVKPEDKSGIIEFLSSNLFPGVGVKLATKIVDELGNDAINKILKDKDVLRLVPKISDKKIDAIYNTLYNYENSHQVIVDITNMGFVLKDALAIYNDYKKETMDIIKNNIYDVVDRVDIDFSKVDKLRSKFDIEPEDPRRISAGIIYVMKKMCYQNGDTYLSNMDILLSLNNHLTVDVTIEEVNKYLDELVQSKKLMKKDDNYYLINLWNSEAVVANKVVMLASKDVKKLDLDTEISNLEKYNNIKYNDKQKEAIIKAIQNNILIITGGPGTGKTTIIKAIVEMYANINSLTYEELVERVALLAPTGRASKRMSESTLMPAMTIHRFLKWNKENNEFAVNQYNPDFSNLIIVDEASMIDIELLSNLFNGLTNNIKLILVGDHNQLPSVGPGQVLKDLIDSNIVDTVKLEYLYRQDENSYIATLASEIKDNNLNPDFMMQKSDYQFLPCEDIVPSLRSICEILKKNKNDYKKFQIMAPMYMGENGIDKLNMHLQQIFNPKENQNEVKYGDVIYRENDKVIQLVNMPDENIFNGDIGVIKKIEVIDSKTLIFIDFDGVSVKYNIKDLAKINHAYIISIHKSQGSEFETVILTMSSAYKRMLYRKLVYTAVTRAKKKLIIIGNPNAFVFAVNNNNERLRKTSLLEKIFTILYNK